MLGTESKRPRLYSSVTDTVNVSSIPRSFMYRDVKWYLALVFGIALAATFFHSCQNSPDSDLTQNGPRPSPVEQANK